MSQPPTSPPDRPANGPSDGPSKGPSARVAAVFDLVADTYDHVGVPWFTPIAEGLVALVAPATGESVVDLGCGRGAVLFPLAAAVGPSGTVVGVDLSARMVELVDIEVKAAGLTNVRLHVMDASTPALAPRGADAVLASLVLFFLPQPQTAVRAWAALLRPGGRLGVSTFAGRDEAWQRLDAIFDPYLPAQMLDARTSGQSGPFATDEGVEDLFTGAGLVDVQTTHADISVDFADVGTWSTWTMSHGQRAMWEQVPESERGSVTAAAAALLDGCRGDDGIARLNQRVRYTLGWAAHATG